MIIECTECKGKVSDKAATCPHCGAPVASPEIKKDPVKPTENEKSSPSYFGPASMVGLIIGGMWAWFGDATVGYGQASWAQGFFIAAQQEGMADQAWLAAWMGAAMIAIPAGLITGFIGMMFGRGAK